MNVVGSFLRKLVRDLLGDLTGDEELPEALIIMQGPCPRRFPGVAVRRVGFIGFPSDQKPQSLVEYRKKWSVLQASSL
jgi:hypothetical protein